MGNQERPLFSSAIVIDTKLFCIGRKWDCTYVRYILPFDHSQCLTFWLLEGPFLPPPSFILTALLSIAFYAVPQIEFSSV